LKFDRKRKRESQHAQQWLFFQEEVQADDQKGGIQRIHLTPLRAVDKNRGQHEEQPSRPIGLISRGIFYAHDAVDKIGGDEIEEDREQFYGGNPGEDGVKQRGAGKKVPKRRRVSD